MSNFDGFKGSSDDKFWTKERDNKGRYSKGVRWVLAIVIAFGLWVYVISETNPTTQEVFTSVPVELLNEESLVNRGLALVGDGEYTVNVTVEGKRGDIQSTDVDAIVATVDLFGYSQGDNYIMVNVNLPANSDVSFVEVRPARILVEIDEFAAVSKEIDVHIDGSLPSGQQLSSASVSPSEVVVSGPKSWVDQVATVDVFVSAEMLDEDGDPIQVEAIPMNEEGLRVENVSLSTPYVDYAANLYPTKTVPVEIPFVGELPEGFVLDEHESVSAVIRGPKSALRSVSSLTAEPVDLSSLAEGLNRIPLRISLPSKAEYARGQEKPYVELIVKPTDSVSFVYDTDDLQLKNLTAEYGVDIASQEFYLTVVGERSVVEMLTQNDFLLSIDLAGVSAGEYTAAVDVIYDPGLKVQSWVLDPSSIDIVVTEKE
ncbi:MAG: hypothetical protein E7224_01270 [Clostridiales bacterium]|nr:hypothetical protein [Clostridiales bacterium]